MVIIYTYLATDGDESNTSLSPSNTDCTQHISLFVANNSKFYGWENNAKIWKEK